MDKLDKYFRLGVLNMRLNFIRMYYGQYNDPLLQDEFDIKLPPKEVLKRFDTESQQRLILIYNYYLKDVNAYKALYVKYDNKTQEVYFSDFYKLLNKINTNIPKTNYVSITVKSKEIKCITLHLNGSSTIKIEIPNIIEAFMFEMSRVDVSTNKQTYEILDTILNHRSNREISFYDEVEIKKLLKGLEKGISGFENHIRIGSARKKLCSRFNPLILLFLNDMTFIDTDKPKKIDMYSLIIDMFDFKPNELDYNDIEEYTKPKYKPPKGINLS